MAERNETRRVEIGAGKRSDSSLFSKNKPLSRRLMPLMLTRILEAQPTYPLVTRSEARVIVIRREVFIGVYVASQLATDG